MPRKVALKISLAGEDVEFYEEEFIDGIEIPVKEVEVTENDVDKVSVSYRGDNWYRYEIRITEQYSDTREKIRKIQDENDTMTIYPIYQYDDTYSKVVGYVPTDDSTYWFSGSPLAKIIHTLIFLEAEK